MTLYTETKAAIAVAMLRFGLPADRARGLAALVRILLSRPSMTIDMMSDEDRALIIRQRVAAVCTSTSGIWSLADLEKAVLS